MNTAIKRSIENVVRQYKEQEEAHYEERVEPDEPHILDDLKALDAYVKTPRPVWYIVVIRNNGETEGTSFCEPKELSRDELEEAIEKEVLEFVEVDVGEGSYEVYVTHVIQIAEDFRPIYLTGYGAIFEGRCEEEESC